MASRKSRHARANELLACTPQDNDVTYVIKHNLQVETSKQNDFQRIPPYVHVWNLNNNEIKSQQRPARMYTTRPAAVFALINNVFSN